VNKKILLVEDEAIIAMTTAKMLEKSGFEVITAHKGEKAVALAINDPDISLILMDIDLGKGMDGTEAAQKILEENDVPIAFLSSHTEPEIVEKTEGITSYGYIVKNSGETVVLASIKMAFRLFEANQQIKEREEALKKEKERLKEHIEIIEERKRIDEQRNTHLLEMYDKIDLSQPDILDYVLHASLEITNSQFAFSGLIEKDETVMTIHRWSTEAMQECSITDKPLEFSIEKAGIWGDCIRERKPIIINDYQNSTRASKHGTPKGHVPIKRFLCVPIFHETKIVAVGAVANKTLPYNDADADALAIMYDKMWSFLKQQQADRQLQESEQKWRSLVENNPDFIAIHDEEGRFLYMNRYAEGFSEEDVIGTSAYEYMSEESTQLFQQKEKECLETWTVQKFEHRAAGNKGIVSWYENFLVPFVENETEKRVIVVSREITKRKLLEQDLRKSERNAHITLNSIGDAVISTDIDGNIVRMNPVAEKLTGWSADFAYGKKLNEVFHILNAETRNLVDNPVEKVLQNGEILGLANHTVLISKEGNEYQIADSAAPIEDDEGNINGVVLVFRDVTEEYEKDLQLREHVKELDCLYSIAKVVEKPKASLSYILQQTAEIVQQSWRYPETCRCKITLNNKTFQSTKFSESQWIMSSDLIVENVVSGKITVCYLDERPTIDEGPFTKEESRLLDAVAERLGRVIERRQAEENLRSIEWMLSNKSSRKEDYFPEYGDVSELNKDGLILSSVGKEQLRGIASEYLDLLDTSTAIYEKNGDYALGIFSSGWCQLMDSASRRLCRTEDNEKALESGKWLCHESCWKDCYLAMEADGPVEIECLGGIKMYAVPIRANGEIVGAMNFGYGNPPTGETELNTLSERYKIPFDELKKQAEAYKPRPQFIIDYAKERIQTAAETLGYLIERKQTEDALKREQFFLSSVLDNIKEAVIICNKNGEITRFNESARTLHQLPEKQIPAERWAEYYDLYYPDGETPLATKDIPLFRALQGEDVNNLEIIVKPKKDTSSLLSCSGQQIKDENGRKNGAVIAMHDITELKNSRDRYKRLINSSPNLIMETDVDTHEIISCNPAMAKNLGTSLQDVIGKKIDEFIPPEILKARVEVSQRAIETREPQTLEDERGGKYFHTTYIPIINNDRPSVQSITTDVTEQKRSENLIKEYANSLELTMEAANIAWWEMDVKTGEVRFNKKKTDMLGYDQEQFHHYQDFTNLLHPDDYEKTMNAMSLHFNGEREKYDIQYRIKTSTGSYLWFHDYGQITERDREGKPLKVAGLVIDITELKQTEQELRESQERFQILHNASFGGITIHDKGVILDCNQGLSDITGYSYDELVGMDGLLLIAPDWRDFVMEKITSKYEEPYEAAGIRKDNSIYPVRLHGKQILYKGNQVRVVEFRDITKQKKLEEEQILLNTTSNEMLEITNRQGLYDYIATQLHSMYPEAYVIYLSVDETKSKVRIETIKGIEDGLLYRIATIFGYKLLGKEYEIEEKMNSVFYSGKLTCLKEGIIELSSKVLPSITAKQLQKIAGIKETYAIGVMKDKQLVGAIHIFCRKPSELKNDTNLVERIVHQYSIILHKYQLENQLRSSLEEKDYLMKELNHRVKNNLAMVSSLVSLKEIETKSNLTDLKNRIEVIKSVHEKLYQQKNIEQIEVKEYFQELLESLFYSTSELAVEVVNNIEEASISTKTAIPLGLVVNEIATNAIKYGFTTSKKARFTIEMTKDSIKNQYILTLSNTGNPFPEEMGLENPETMGLQLISSLVQQINGTIELRKKPNTVFTLRFPVED